MASRRLVLVHAHPDDESLGTGGTMARYADEGAQVCLITCTNGEAGEVADVPELGTIDEITRRLGDVRIDELREACRHLGDIDLRLLGYHDSGMAGTDTNDDPKAFINQDIDGVVHKVVAILRELRPQVLITYNEIGFYGHPDHIRAHEVAVRAVRAAADPAYAPDTGAPHEVAKTYFTAVGKSIFRHARELAEQIGADPDDFFSDEDIENVGTDDDRITTVIDVGSYLDRKFASVEAHRTQRGTTERFLSIPPDIRAATFGTEQYVLARSTLPMPEAHEHDLFEGLV